MNVLIIDDDQEDIALFCEALIELFPDAHCYIMYTCVNIKATIESLGIPDIIFFECHMHPVDGRECLIELNKFLDRRKTKVILYSNSVSNNQRTELEKLGVDFVLTKANNYQEIKTNINDVIVNRFKLAS